MDADGRNQQAVDIGLGGVLYPSLSGDGQLLAVTAPDPFRPAKISPDVFVVNTQSGRIDKLTTFEDFANADGFTFTVPMWKAFSPDASQIAIAGFLYTGARGTLIFTNRFGQQLGPYQPLSAVQSAPALAIYFANGTPPITMDSGLPSDQDLSHRGEGVDWSPNGEVVAYPRTIQAPTPSGTPISLTAIQLLRPVANAAIAAPVQQATFPTGVWGQPFDPFVGAWADDFLPAFSPNGRGLAYVRAYSVFTFAGLDFATPSIRIADLDGSRDFEVVRFPKATYITRVSWAPDGTRLVFDLGRQASSDGFPLKSADFSTLEVYTIGVDGTGLVRLLPPAAGSPLWLPEPPDPPVEPTLSVSVLEDGTGTPRVILTWPSGPGLILEDSPALGPAANWQTVTTAPELVGDQARLEIKAGAPAGFFRLRQGQ
jgi:hypothetical protein